MLTEEKIFTNYTDIQIQIQRLERLKKELAIECLKEMQKNKLKQMKNEFGTFSVVERKNWKYSNIVKLLEEDVKSTKHAEEENGKAVFSVSESLRFQLTKPKVGELKLKQ